MKRYLLIMLVGIFILLSGNAYALTSFWQTGVALDASGQILDNTTVAVRVTIYDASGAQVYQQTFASVATSQFAVFKVEVDGTGTGNFGLIDADAGTRIVVETDAGSGWVLSSAQALMQAQYNTIVVELDEHHIIMGDNANNGEDVEVGGDLTGANDGAGHALFTIVNDAVTPAKIKEGSNGQVLYTNASNNVEWHNFSDLETDPQVGAMTDDHVAVWDNTSGSLVNGIMTDNGTVATVGGNFAVNGNITLGDDATADVTTMNSAFVPKYNSNNSGTDFTIPDGTMVMYITSPPSNDTWTATLPSGTNGQMIFIRLISNGTDRLYITDGTTTYGPYAGDVRFLFIYINNVWFRFIG